MTLPNRICCTVFMMDNVLNITSVATYFLQPALLYWGRDLMVFTTISELRWQLRLCAIWVWMLRISDVMCRLPTGFVHGQRYSISYQWMQPYLAYSLIRCFFIPAWLGRKNMPFTASGSIADRLQERSARNRAPLHRRLKLIVLDYGAWFHIAYIAIVYGAVIRDWVRVSHIPTTRAKFFHLLTHSFLPPAWWVMFTTTYLLPIVYAINPPTVPDREDLLERDPLTLVARPKERVVKELCDITVIARETIFVLITIYVTILFVLTFIYI
jgi:hypothetical protein